MKTEEAWKPLLETVMPHFQKEPMRFVIDLTSYAEHAQVIYLGIIQHSRVLPLVWKVMPGQEKWDQGLWDAIEELFKRLEPYLEKADCTLIGVRLDAFQWCNCVKNMDGTMCFASVDSIRANTGQPKVVSCQPVPFPSW